MKSVSFVTAFIANLALSSGSCDKDLIISGVIDAKRHFGVGPKAIELYALNDISDLSEFCLTTPNNGSDTTETCGSSDLDYNMTGSVTAGTYLYVSMESHDFTKWFGFTPDFVDPVALTNGNSAVVLFHNDEHMFGDIVDFFGEEATSGTGSDWEYTIGWAYRNSNSMPSATFDLADWSFSGKNGLFGAAFNDDLDARVLFPSKTYSNSCVGQNSMITGDPHIETWSGTKYDFHGVCDLVLLQNHEFQKGVKMDIHVRTKQLKEFSYVSSAVLRIGDDMLEVMGDLHENLYWINKQANANLNVGINGHPISYRRVNSKQHEFTVHLNDGASIVMRTFKRFVRVAINGATKDSFGSSRGLLGSYGSGKLIARNDSFVFEDVNEFGQNWQVLPSDGMLFHNVEGPQAPAKCDIPIANNIRRRLSESHMSEEEAEVACARVNPDDFDMCVFDVMATGDKDVVGAY